MCSCSTDNGTLVLQWGMLRMMRESYWFAMKWQRTRAVWTVWKTQQPMNWSVLLKVARTCKLACNAYFSVNHHNHLVCRCERKGIPTLVSTEISVRKCRRQHNGLFPSIEPEVPFVCDALSFQDRKAPFSVVCCLTKLKLTSRAVYFRKCPWDYVCSVSV